MPTCRSITVQLHSQFDIQPFPEYVPKPQEHYDSRGIQAEAPLYVDEKTSTCSVYIAVFPGSTFWLSYSVAPPVPEDQHFLFKLFINGAHIVSWSAGKAEKWKGKTMFGLFERHQEDGDERKKMEKRAMRFMAPHDKDVRNAFDHDANVEIRVHRASGRMRVGWETEKFAETAHGKNPRGIELANAGRAGGDHPKRFYKFALIDPTDQPFMTFRYYYRTWEQLRYLALVDGIDVDDTGTEMSVIEPYEEEAPMIRDSAKKRLSFRQEGQCDVFHPDKDSAKTVQPPTYTPKGAPCTGTSSSDDWSVRSQRHSGVTTPPQFYRLSVPPALKLEHPQHSSRPLPSIPQKSDLTSSTAYRPHPAYPMEDWMANTPSPVKSIRDLTSTPPLVGKKTFAPSSLVNAVTSAWRRRGMTSSEVSSGTDSRNSTRSVP